MLDSKIVFKSKKIKEWFSNLENWKYVDEKLFNIIQNGGKIIIAVDYYEHCIDLIESIIPFEVNEIDLSLPNRHEIVINKTNLIFGLESVDLSDYKIKSYINLALYPNRNTIIICEEEILSKLEEDIDYIKLDYNFTKLNIKDPRMLIQRMANSRHDFRVTSPPFMHFLYILDICFHIWEIFELERHRFNLRDYINRIWELLNEYIFRSNKKYIIWQISGSEEKKYQDFLKEIFGKAYIKHFEELDLSNSEKKLRKLIMLYNCVKLNFVRIQKSDLIMTPLAKELTGEVRQFISNPLVFGWEKSLLDTVKEYNIESFKSITPPGKWTEHINEIEKIMEEISDQDIQISIPYHFIRLKMAALAILTSRAFRSTRIPEIYVGTSEYKDKLWTEYNRFGRESVKNYADSLKYITERFLNGEIRRSELDSFLKSNFRLEENLLTCSPILNDYIAKNTSENLGAYLNYQSYLKIFVEEEFIDEIKERLHRDIEDENLQLALREFAKILDIYGKFLYVIQATSKADIDELMDQMNSRVIEEFLDTIEQNISNYETSKVLNNIRENLDFVMDEIKYLVNFYDSNIEKPFSRFSHIVELADTMQDLYGEYEKHGITPDLITKLFCYYNRFSQEKSEISKFLMRFYSVINDEIVNEYPGPERFWNVTQIRQIIHYLLGEETSVPEEIDKLNPAQIVVLLIMDALSYQDWTRIRSGLSPTVASPMLTTFPTETAPCHMSVFTGVFPSEHGIVSNTFIDRKKPLEEITLLFEERGEESSPKRRTNFSELIEQRLWLDSFKNYILSPFPSKTKLSQLFKGRYSVEIIASEKCGTEMERLEKLKTILATNIKNIYEKGDNIRVLIVVLHPRVDKEGHSGVGKDETIMSHEASILAHVERYIEDLLENIKSATKGMSLKVFLIVTGDHGRIRKDDLTNLTGTEKIKIDEKLVHELRNKYESAECGSLIHRYLPKMRSSFVYSLNDSDPLKKIPNSITKEDWWILQKKDIDRILGRKSSEYKPDLIISPKYRTFYSMKQQATHGGFSLHEILVPFLVFEIGGD